MNHIHTHTGEKPYVCEVFNEKFSMRGNVNNHLQTHKGEKPYVCEISMKMFL